MGKIILIKKQVRGAKLKNSAESQPWADLLHEFWPAEFDENGDEVA